MKAFDGSLFSSVILFNLSLYSNHRMLKVMWPEGEQDVNQVFFLWLSLTANVFS